MNPPLGKAMRALLGWCGVMNLVAAVTLAPPLGMGQALLGLPTTDPLYLWILSAWTLGFGVSFLVQAKAGRAERGVLWIAAWGKGVFAGLLLAKAVGGTLPLVAGMAAAPDLLLAIVFATWLRRTAAGDSARHSPAA